MKTIDIRINKARISSCTIYYKDDKPRVQASIELLSDAGEAITTYTIDSESTWDKSKHFDLPYTLINPIVNILNELEEIVTEHCKDRIKMIEVKEASE